MILPYNSEDLVFATKASTLLITRWLTIDTGAAASPFVVAIKNAGIPG